MENMVSHANWSTVGSAKVVISLEATGTTVSARQMIVTSPNTAYTITWTVSGSCSYLLIGTTSAGSEIKSLGTCYSAGNQSYSFTAPSNETWIRFQRTTSGTSTISNIVMAESSIFTREFSPEFR